jgi:hypothetical protein
MVNKNIYYLIILVIAGGFLMKSDVFIEQFDKSSIAKIKYIRANSAEEPFNDTIYNTGYMCENFNEVYNITKIEYDDGNILKVRPINLSSKIDIMLNFTWNKANHLDMVGELISTEDKP